MAKDGPATTAAGPGGDEALRKQRYKLNREIKAAMPVCLGTSGLGHSRRIWHDRVRSAFPKGGVKADIPGLRFCANSRHHQVRAGMQGKPKRWPSFKLEEDGETRAGQGRRPSRQRAAL
jgi:hypothetical protein